jgi:hypothetical protein
MTAYSAQRILEEERQVVNGAPVGAVALGSARIAMPRRAGLGLSSLTLTPAADAGVDGDDEDEDGLSPLDVPAFLRRQEG